MGHIEIIKDNNEILAIIIRNKFSDEGIKFFTPDDFSQQLAYMHHKKGKTIKPHIHNVLMREIHFTQEVLFIKRGKLKVDMFRKNKSYLSSHILESGDVIMLAAGGHGLEVIEDIEMFEVKQGPYSKELDKTHFEAADDPG